MLSPAESRAALKRVTAESVNYSVAALKRVSGSPDVRRARLLELVPAIVGYYSDGSSALAADFYEDQREAAGERSRFVADPVVTDRVVNLRRGVAWSADPLFSEGGEFEAARRLADVVQLETARPFRDTILSNSSRDTASVGWRRVTRGGCSLCRMLADRGAVYREATARFATHPNCGCTAQPVFGANDTGEEASVLQYVASRRSRTPAQQAVLRDYLDSYFPNIPKVAKPVRPRAATRNNVPSSDSLTESQKLNVYRYTGGEGPGANGLLRSLDRANFTGPINLQMVRELDAAMSGKVFESTVQLQRRVSPKSLVRLGDEAMDPATYSSLVGTTIKDAGYLSTSLPGTVADDYISGVGNIEFRITAPAGTRGFYIGKAGREKHAAQQEVLLDRGQRLQIVGYTKPGKDGIHRFDVVLDTGGE